MWQVLAGLFGSLAGRWFDLKTAQEENLHAETLASARIAAETERAIGRGQGKFGAFVDAYTRLMRPLILTLSIAGIIWIVWLSYTDPRTAVAFFEAVAMAEDLILMLLVFPLAHFGIRPFEKASIFRQTANFALRRMQAGAIEAATSEAETDKRLKAELDDTSKPLSNWAIVEINRRMREGRPIRPS